MTDIEENARHIEMLRTELAGFRPLSPSVLTAIREPYDFELTYTSNAIEGNTLTLRETEEVIAHGTTIGGKNINDHLEAIDHHEALKWMYAVAAADEPLTSMTVRQLHQLVPAKSKPDIAGQLAVTQRGISSSNVTFPSAAEVRPLMTDFGDDLQHAEMTPRGAFDAHRRLVTIHPFDDGNGRTARLLMNMMLVRGGYRPVAIRPSDRIEYLDTLEKSQLTADDAPYQALMHRRLDETMTKYVGLVREAVRNVAALEDGPETNAGATAAQFARWQQLLGEGR